jgi:hypothetical protein
MDRALTAPRTGGLIEDVGLLLLIAFMAPVVILILGMPIALAVRLALEVARRW